MAAASAVAFAAVAFVGSAVAFAAVVSVAVAFAPVASVVASVAVRIVLAACTEAFAAVAAQKYLAEGRH